MLPNECYGYATAAAAVTAVFIMIIVYFKYIYVDEGPFAAEFKILREIESYNNKIIKILTPVINKLDDDQRAAVLIESDPLSKKLDMPSELVEPLSGRYESIRKYYKREDNTHIPNLGQLINFRRYQSDVFSVLESLTDIMKNTYNIPDNISKLIIGR